jgi:hypothetical protein
MTRPAELLVLLPLLCACGAGSKPRGAARIDDLVQRGQYEQAVQEAAALVEQDPDDPVALDSHRMASVAWLMQQGREATFEDEDVTALRYFREAARLAPDDPIVSVWVDKAKGKLARRWRELGQELHAEDELEAAIDAYARSLEFVPGEPSTLASMGNAVLVVNHRAGLSREYYSEGMRAMSDYWLEVARSRFSYSHKYDAESERTERRLEDVRHLLAAERLAIGRQLEQDGRWGAARNEYRLALALEPENAGARAAFDQAEVEAAAARVLDEIHMWILRGDLEKAEELIAEGLETTEHQDDLFEGARAEIEEARLSAMYEKALNFERDFLYEQAIAGYAEVLAETAYYRDVLTRKETLEEYVRRAQELYERSRGEEGAKRLETLRQIETFWPGYRDIDVEIAKLRDAGPE